ncbi:MAG: type II CAAX endopeptidase family protein [Pseudomonadota bacterium]|nr:type II CAAX endopeptidase family protein [Pseudomonadota bacterium]
MSDKANTKGNLVSSEETYTLAALPAAIILYTLFVLALFHWPKFADTYAISLETISDLSLVIPNIITLYCILVCCILVRVSRPISKMFAFRTFNFKLLLLWSILFFIISIVAGWLKHSFTLPITSDWEIYLFNKKFATLLFLTITIIVVPFLEELLFRGFIFGCLARSIIGSGGAIVITSYLWAIPASYHNPYLLAINLTFGFLLGLARYQSRTVWVPIVLHIISSIIESSTLMSIHWPFLI